MAHDQVTEGFQFCTSDFQPEADVPTYDQAFMLVQAAFKRLLHHAQEAIETGNFKIGKARCEGGHCLELKHRLQAANRLGVRQYCQEFTARCLLDCENSSLCNLEGCSLFEFVQEYGAEQYALLLLAALATVDGSDDLKDSIASVVFDGFMQQVGSDRASLMECCFDGGRTLLRELSER